MDNEENKRLEELAEELAPAPVEEEEEDDGELPEEATPEQIEEAERLLQQASLAKIRGQGSVAERFLKEATEAAPGSAVVQAALGDQLWERSQFSRARKAYQRAHELEPKNAAYETKWAESLVGSMGDPLSFQGDMEEVYASAKVATFLSIVLPGLGQVVMGEKKTGVLMMVLYSGGWLWASLVPHGLSGIPTALGVQGTLVEAFNASVLLPLAIVIVTWLWAVLSANTKVKTQSKRKIDRPAPPGKGDFEM